MKRITIILLLCFQVTFSKTIIYDLTYPFSNQTIYWPTGDPEDNFEFVKRVQTSQYEANRFRTPEHGGTHLDAPRHFAPGHQGVHEINLQRLIGKAFFVDVSEEAKRNKDLLITQEHFEIAEKVQGKTLDDHIVILYTGWSAKYPNKAEYLGTDTNDASILHFPGLHPNAATWLVNNRQIKCIGLDTPSIDRGQSIDFLSHIILLKANIPVFENVNLKEFHDYKAKKNLMIYALPMLIKDGSGAPVRIIAIYDNHMSRNSENTPKRNNKYKKNEF